MYNILIFGDSLTLGRGIGFDKSWLALLSQSISTEDQKNTIIFNLGIPGNTSGDIAKRIDLELKPRTKNSSKKDLNIIIIQIGINDAKNIKSVGNTQTDLSQFSKNIRNIIKSAKKYSDCIYFLGITPVKESESKKTGSYYFRNYDIERYNAAIKNICSKTAVSFIEIYKNWIRTNYCQYLLDDGIHLNQFGHKKIFTSLRKFIVL